MSESSENEPLSPSEWLELNHIVAIEPRFGEWLQQHTIPEAKWTPYWTQVWAGQMFGEAMIAGDAATLAPFLAVLNGYARRPDGLDNGWYFADSLYTVLEAAGISPYLDMTILPPNLLASWNSKLSGMYMLSEEYRLSRDETYTYGRY